MPVSVYIPTPFRRLTDEQAMVEVSAANVRQLLSQLEEQFPGLRERLRDESGRLHHYLNLYVNDEEINNLQGGDTPLRDGDRVSLIPALAGGAPDLGSNGPAVAHLATPAAFTPEQVVRYSRHLLLPNVGRVGQLKLMQAKVLLIGAGGLGSPAALYLAAAGVGTLGIVDFDTVDLTNLQRQILHHTHDVGRPKVHSAQETLDDLNPNVRVVPHHEALSSENALEIFSQYDIVVNGCDNFPTRYLTNDACVLLGKPLVDGGINQFEGQSSVFAVRGNACYRCLFPAPPPPGMVQSCAEAGVIGVLPGIVGSIQALETIKLILGIGEPLIGRLLLFDALSMEFRVLKVPRDPDCPVCGDDPTIRELIDYHEFCGVPHPDAAVSVESPLIAAVGTSA